MVPGAMIVAVTVCPFAKAVSYTHLDVYKRQTNWQMTEWYEVI